MTPPTPPRLTAHTCKHCHALLALIDERARIQRFALKCAACHVVLVLRPAPVLELGEQSSYSGRSEVVV